ncbi:MAG: GerMN domain-containing protein [Nitrospirae bacterium]|nr:GerMN domain-containing protein [Nitrospirota bacterium]
MRKGKIALIILVPILLIAGVTAAYFFFVSHDESDTSSRSIIAMKSDERIVDANTPIKLFYPDATELKSVTVKVAQTFDNVKIAQIALSELFSGANLPVKGLFPADTKILGAYYGIDRVFYVDLSAEFQKNFHGSTLEEFMLLKSVYETIVSNIEADDVSILVNGAQIESLSGHFYLKYPLKRLVTQEIKEK